MHTVAHHEQEPQENQALRAWASDRLYARGGRSTLGRDYVIDALVTSAGHLTTEQIYTTRSVALQHLDRSTVHRTLTRLVQDGVIHEVHGRRAVSFGLARKEHAHLVCTLCGHIADVADPQPETSWSSTGGFMLHPDTLIAFGTCRHCRTSATSAAPRGMHV